MAILGLRLGIIGLG